MHVWRHHDSNLSARSRTFRDILRRLRLGREAIDSHMANSSVPSESSQEEQADGETSATSAASEPVDIVASGECDIDAEFIDCKVVLPTMNGTNNCFVGTQVCVDGEWSACMTDADALEMVD